MNQGFSLMYFALIFQRKIVIQQWTLVNMSANIKIWYPFFTSTFLHLKIFSSPIFLRRRIYGDAFLAIFLRRRNFLHNYVIFLHRRISADTTYYYQCSHWFKVVPPSDCIYFHTPVCNTLGCGGVLIAWFILRSYLHTPGGVELGVCKQLRQKSQAIYTPLTPVAGVCKQLLALKQPINTPLVFQLFMDTQGSRKSFKRSQMLPRYQADPRVSNKSQ